VRGRKGWQLEGRFFNMGGTMHLQQTKSASRVSGGPQYWFEDVPEHIRGHLQRKKACPVILMTPYGPVETPFVAVDRDYKLRRGRLLKANAQHDRIQRGDSKESIGEAIRRWFALREGADFERVDIKVTFDNQSRFILIPQMVKWRHSGWRGRPASPRRRAGSARSAPGALHAQRLRLS
jgi:hypothetical protein